MFSRQGGREWFRKVIWWTLTNGIYRWEPHREGNVSDEARCILLLSDKGGVLCCCCNLRRRCNITIYKQFIMLGELVLFFCCETRGWELQRTLLDLSLLARLAPFLLLVELLGRVGVPFRHPPCLFFLLMKFTLLHPMELLACFFVMLLFYFFSTQTSP